MSSFVTPENQKLMWDIICTNPLVNTYFSVQRSTTKEEWFRSIIERFYTQNKNIQLTNTQLHDLNKTVIRFMIQSIHQMNGNNAQGQLSPTNTNRQFIQTPPIVENNREQIYKSEFERKKEEYESMVRKEVPKPIQFQESSEDTPITDMDALIKQHMDDRKKSIESLQPQLTPQLNPQQHSGQKEMDKKIDNLTNIIETLQQEVVLLKTQMKQFGQSQTNDNKELSYSSLSIIPEENTIMNTNKEELAE